MLVFEYDPGCGAWVDITEYIHDRAKIEIRRGLEPNENTTVAAVGRLSLTLNNRKDAFTPQAASCLPGFAAGARIRLTLNQARLFTGRVGRVAPTWPTGEPIAAIECEDDMAFLQRQRLPVFPLMLNVTAQTIITQILAGAYRWPGTDGYLIWNHTCSTWDSFMWADAQTGLDLETGESTWPFVADSWQDEGITARDAIILVCASENPGHFWIAADGTPTFRGRHARGKKTSPDYALANKPARVLCTQDTTRMANHVEVTVYPRTVGEDVEVLWGTSSPLHLQPNIPRDTTGRYKDPDNEAIRCGGMNMIPTVPGTDFIVNTKSDGTGTDITTSCAIQSVLGGNSCRFKVTAPQKAYITKLQARGYALRSYVPVTAEYTDQPSIDAHDRRTLHQYLRLEDDPEIGDHATQYALSMLKSPPTNFEVSFEARLTPQVLSIDIGDRIQVAGKEGFVDTIHHKIDHRTGSCTTTLHCSPTSLFAPWVWDTSLWDTGLWAY